MEELIEGFFLFPVLLVNHDLYNAAVLLADFYSFRRGIRQFDLNISSL